jgi:hypothetical protein
MVEPVLPALVPYLLLQHGDLVLLEVEEEEREEQEEERVRWVLAECLE